MTHLRSIPAWKKYSCAEHLACEDVYLGPKNHVLHCIMSAKQKNTSNLLKKVSFTENMNMYTIASIATVKENTAGIRAHKYAVPFKKLSPMLKEQMTPTPETRLLLQL